MHVFRSVLDKKPRIATLYLKDSLCLAFDTEHCGIFKIWQGGIRKEGAPFTHIKNVQPTSWGDVFYEKNLNSIPISVHSENEKLKIEHQFNGYEIEEDLVSFNYHIAVQGFDNIDIKENYSIEKSEGNIVALLRHFSINNLNEKLKLNITGSSGEIVRINEQNWTSEYPLQNVLVHTPRAILNKGDESLGKLRFDKSACGSCHNLNKQGIGPALIDIANRYPPRKDNIEFLSARIKKGGSGIWGNAKMIPHPKHSDAELHDILKWMLSLASVDHVETEIKKRITTAKPNEESEIQKSPGFGLPLTAHHPSYDLQTIRKSGFKPFVGGMDIDQAGNLYISTWDSLGAVYKMENVESADTTQILITQIAVGLAEPLGLEVVDEEIYVLQKHELTQLIDHDKDGITDEYRTISNTWEVTDDFHEFAFGLQYKEGYFYVSLSLGMRLMNYEKQKKERGTVIKIKKMMDPLKYSVEV